MYPLNYKVFTNNPSGNLYWTNLYKKRESLQKIEYVKNKDLVRSGHISIHPMFQIWTHDPIGVKVMSSRKGKPLFLILL